MDVKQTRQRLKSAEIRLNDILTQLAWQRADLDQMTVVKRPIKKRKGFRRRKQRLPSSLQYFYAAAPAVVSFVQTQSTQPSGAESYKDDRTRPIIHPLLHVDDPHTPKAEQHQNYHATAKRLREEYNRTHHLASIEMIAGGGPSSSMSTEERDAKRPRHYPPHPSHSGITAAAQSTLSPAENPQKE